jgi:hypothetical protein
MPGPFNLRCSVDALLLSPRPVMKLDHDLDMWQVTTGGNAVVLAVPEILIAIDTTCGRGVDSPTATVGRSSKAARRRKGVGLAARGRASRVRLFSSNKAARGRLVSSSLVAPGDLRRCVSNVGEVARTSEA